MHDWTAAGRTGGVFPFDPGKGTWDLGRGSSGPSPPRGTQTLTLEVPRFKTFGPVWVKGCGQ